MKNLKYITLSIVAISFIACGSGSSSSSSDDSTSDATSTTTQTSEDAEVSTSEASTTDTTSSAIISYKLTDTNQVKCYDNEDEITCPVESEAFYGQDAQYSGNQPSYTDNGDGTITDNTTGLMWQQVPNSSDMSWSDAVAYCNELELGGYSDWRMPTVKELFALQDFSNGWPYVDTTYFSLASGEVTKDEQYWTSTKYVGVTSEGGSDAVFGVNEVTGHIKAYPSGDSMPANDSENNQTQPPQQSSSDANSSNQPPQQGASSGGNPLYKYVRAVRGTTVATNDFTDNGDGTVTDNATGLMWAQADNGAGLDWEDALSYAENSELAGHTDWRLPNVKELQSIVDYRYSTSSTDASLQKCAIDNTMFTCTSITNEAGNFDYGYYWTSTSARFNSGGNYYYAWYVAFGQAVDGGGNDSHGAGAVRFDTKYEGGEAGEGGERYYNYVRIVRNAE